MKLLVRYERRDLLPLFARQSRPRWLFMEVTFILTRRTNRYHSSCQAAYRTSGAWKKDRTLSGRHCRPRMCERSPAVIAALSMGVARRPIPCLTSLFTYSSGLEGIASVVR